MCRMLFSPSPWARRLSAREATGDSGTLHIGVSTTLCKYLLLPYLKEFIREHPSIRHFHYLPVLGPQPMKC